MPYPLPALFAHIALSFLPRAFDRLHDNKLEEKRFHRAQGLKTLMSKNDLSNRPPQTPLADTSKSAASSQFADFRPIVSPVKVVGEVLLQHHGKRVVKKL